MKRNFYSFHYQVLNFMILFTNELLLRIIYFIDKNNYPIRYTFFCKCYVINYLKKGVHKNHYYKVLSSFKL